MQIPFTTHYSPFTKVNYIRHLNAFFSFVKADNRLTSSHVSLYLALFQYWNFNRFQNPFPVYRENIMQLSKIGSKNTYHKCVKQLHLAQYIIYHPALSKYQPVKISMIRLDIRQEKTHYTQLDLFSPKYGTQHVPHLTGTSPKNETPQVPDLGHSIKPNLKQRETPAHNFFKKNREKKETETGPAQVADLIHTANNIPSMEGLGVAIPERKDVGIYFQQNNYPDAEAIKFYNHYKALGWKIQGKTPIADWKPLVEKWMTNAKNWNAADRNKSSPEGGGFRRGPGVANTADEIQYLYETFLEGKKIFHHIAPGHFDLLQLQVTEETLHQARQERISQVTGTNQHSLNQLWDAYLKGDDTNDLIRKDKPRLIALAKRMQVLKHFQELQQSGINLITIKSDNP